MRGSVVTRKILSGFLVLTGVLAGSPSVWAGPNQNGSLLLHAPVGIPSGDQPLDTYCELDNIFPNSCDEILSNVPNHGGLQAWFVLAVFDETSDPRVSAITFGVDYDDTTVFLAEIATCTDFELSTPNWPDPGEGTAVTWLEAQTERIIPAYAFAGYEYYGQDVSFDLIPHPTQGGVFADDSIPAQTDDIAAFGSLGFNGDPGSAPCPIIDPTPALDSSWGQIKLSYK